MLITIAAYNERDSRILVVTTRAVRRYLNSRRWACPGNVSWLHFGALRGRDFAKNYAGFIQIGRSQMQIGDVDGIAAGFGHDNAVKYEPFDKRGDGMLTDEDTLWRDKEIVTVQMRDGNDLRVTGSYMPAGPGRDVEAAWREEEGYQAITRLRTAHREGRAPWAIILGQVIPAGVIVDVSTTLQDLIRVPQAKSAEAARIAGELVNPPGFVDIDNALDDEDLRDYATRAAVERRAIEIRSFDKKISAGAATDAAWRAIDAEARPPLYSQAGLSETIIAAAGDEDALVALGVDVAATDNWAREKVAQMKEVETEADVVEVFTAEETPPIWTTGEDEPESELASTMAVDEDDYIPFDESG